MIFNYSQTTLGQNYFQKKKLKKLHRNDCSTNIINIFLFQQDDIRLFSNIAGTKWISKKEIKGIAQERLYNQYYASVAQPANKIIETFDSNEITEVL